MPDIIRVFRVIEYVGDRAIVEHNLKRVLYGEKIITGVGGTMTIKAATLGVVPEIVKQEGD